MSAALIEALNEKIADLILEVKSMRKKNDQLLGEVKKLKRKAKLAAR